MKFFVWLFIIFAILMSYIFISVAINMDTKMNEVDIWIDQEDIKDGESQNFNIAVIGDTHTSETDKDYLKLEEVLTEVERASPDLIAFVGDYTGSPGAINDFEVHRKKIINILTESKKTPKVFVLGNYESYSDPEKWIEEFEANGAIVLENEIILLETDAGKICIRGLGDYYTKRFRGVDFPESCSNSFRITLTHDPAGAFQIGMEGLFISGHTHCGQISFPFIGPLWVPTEAPEEAHCGLYQDNMRTVFTTSGVGTAIFPVRFGAQSNWDLLVTNIN